MSNRSNPSINPRSLGFLGVLFLLLAATAALAFGQTGVTPASGAVPAPVPYVDR
jgi:hypothetical protein